MLKKRLIPVLILRDGNVVQSLQFKHTNIIHSMPTIAVDYFNRWAADEIVILDVSPTSDGRENFYSAVYELSGKCFVPLTAGGWITNTDDIKHLLRLGADKVTINTQAVRKPSFIKKAAQNFGSQCIVVSIDARKNKHTEYEVFIDRGRESTGLKPAEWAREARKHGAGEIYITSIDRDGSRKGYDKKLIGNVAASVDIPVIAFGGVSKWEHLVEGIEQGAEAVAAANVFHYTEHSAKNAKEYMKKSGIDVR